MSKACSKLREVDLLVLSDIHLGTYGCHAVELAQYLSSIQPKKVILNGDIIDIWQFKKRYWPHSHMGIIKQFIQWISDDIEVHYITGNHDEMLRKFVPFEMNSFRIENKLVVELNGKKAWFFHGDVFDVTMQHSKWLTKLGAVGYDMLILLNRGMNKLSEALGKEKLSLSKKIKDSVKGAVKYINNFEQTVKEIAIENKYDYVICGHIHQPCIKRYMNQTGNVMYLNSGDWVENLTALEFHDNKWSIYQYNDKDFKSSEQFLSTTKEKSTKELFSELLNDFKIGTTL
ncbi:UDP-2,3-diacylglucosamine diphosphatase [Flavobacteriaceae bacterium F08102]|nr:UDP-2,3-diacylglucosamine diphosphatase [Flavobacteriaceae bacterium F08102]